MSNALEAPVEGDWGYRIKDRDLAAIATKGFDTIRLPVRFQAGYRNGRVDPGLLARVDDVAGMALSLGLNVILDFHHFREIMEEPDENRELFLKIWSELARHYEGWPDGLIFELLNEPQAKLTTARADRLYDAVIPIIRERHPRRWIVVGGGNWSIWQELKKLKARDDFTAFTFHFYDPFDFTHQGAEWVSDPPPPRRGPLTDAEVAEIYREIAALADFGQPLLLGEFGVHVEVPIDQRALWTRHVRKASERAGIPWCHWGFASGFRVVDDDLNWLPGFRDALFSR